MISGAQWPIRGLMAANPSVLVYRTRSCPFCVMAEQLLRNLGIPFREEFLDDHRDRRGATEAILAGHRTVPLVLIDGQPVGGYRELRTLADRGGLDHLTDA